MSEKFIPTRGSMIKSESLIDFEFVTYQSHQSKKNEKTEPNLKQKSINATKSNEFNIKRAKHEIIKFGISGFDPQKKEEAKVQLAIKLGAKPPKNKYKNYKVLQQERAKQKEAEKLKASFQQLGKNSVGKSVAKGKGFDRKRRKKKDGLLDVYGK
ncbi:C1orf131 -like, partial [Asbolus verrucosus]